MRRKARIPAAHAHSLCIFNYCTLGGNLSPLLSNIYLTTFDRMLESRGHKFVRYADDCNIYVKSHRAAERVMASCVSYLEGKLKLKVNREKSRTGSPLRLKFLGFSLCKIGKKTGIRPHGKSIKRFKDKIREITSRKQGKPIAAIKAKHDNLVCLGIPNSKAWEWANSRLGYWRIAHSWILTRSLTNEYLTSIGYDDISKRYEVLHLNH